MNRPFKPRPRYLTPERGRRVATPEDHYMDGPGRRPDLDEFRRLLAGASLAEVIAYARRSLADNATAGPSPYSITLDELCRRCEGLADTRGL